MSVLDASILDDIYAGALDPARWESGVLRIGAKFGASCAALFSFDAVACRVRRDEGYRLPPGSLEDYRYWVQRDPRKSLLDPKPPLVAHGEAQLLPLKDWRRTPIFNEFLKPMDCTYVLCAWLHKSARHSVALSYQATFDRGPFSEEDRRTLDPYLPHLARVIEIRDRLEGSAIRAETLVTGLTQTRFGLMVLDDVGRILEANPVAEKLLREESGVLRDRDGGLRLSNGADAELQRRLRPVAALEPRASATIHVPRRLQPTLSVMLTPVPETSPLWFGPSPTWIVFFFDPSLTLAPSHQLLAGELGVSEREAQLVALLVQGLDLKQAIRRLSISMNTARQHLKSVFAKTGTRSQADLVRRVLRGPTGTMRN